MGAKRVLFLDDRSDRIESARRVFCPPKFKLTCVFTVKECLDKLSREEFDQVWLDYDLDFSHYELNKPSGMNVAEYLSRHYWPSPPYTKPTFFIHSINKFGAETLSNALKDMDFRVFIEPWKYPRYLYSIVTGSFDVIHPEYIRLFKEAKQFSSFLTVALNVNKPNCVLSADEREEILWSIRYVDDVVHYHSEDELTDILVNLKRKSQNRLLRVSGDDHKGKSTREHLNIDYHYKPYGEWSATKIKKLYGESVNGK